MGCQATVQFQILFLFLLIEAVEANDCNLGELNINVPPPLSATYDRPEPSLQSRESVLQPGTSIRKPEPSFIHQHQDSPLETGSGSYSTAESSSQGQYHKLCRCIFRRINSKEREGSALPENFLKKMLGNVFLALIL